MNYKKEIWLITICCLITISGLLALFSQRAMAVTTIDDSTFPSETNDEYLWNITKSTGDWVEAGYSVGDVIKVVVNDVYPGQKDNVDCLMVDWSYSARAGGVWTTYIDDEYYMSYNYTQNYLNASQDVLSLLGYAFYIVPTPLNLTLIGESFNQTGYQIDENANSITFYNSSEIDGAKYHNTTLSFSIGGILIRYEQWDSTGTVGIAELITKLPVKEGEAYMYKVKYAAASLGGYPFITNNLFKYDIESLYEGTHDNIDATILNITLSAYNASEKKWYELYPNISYLAFNGSEDYFNGTTDHILESYFLFCIPLPLNLIMIGESLNKSGYSAIARNLTFPSIIHGGGPHPVNMTLIFGNDGVTQSMIAKEGDTTVLVMELYSPSGSLIGGGGGDDDDDDDEEPATIPFANIGLLVLVSLASVVALVLFKRRKITKK